MKALLTLNSALLLAMFAGLTAAPAPALAWWTCQNGTLAVRSSNNQHVQCTHSVPYNCPKVILPGTNVQVGTDPVVRAGKDVCRALQSTIDFDYVCPVGYNRVEQSGSDVCRSYSAPTRDVS